MPSQLGCQSDDRITLILMKTKHPIYIILLGVVTSECDVLLPLVLPPGFCLNTEANIKCLGKVGLTWIERVAAGKKNYFSQQNFAPCDTSRWIQSLVRENFCNHIIPKIWPPICPDCNPFAMAGVWWSKRPTKFRATSKINQRQG